MNGAVQAETLPRGDVIEVWFHGFGYNATPGSRTILSSVADDTIKNGFNFCFDPEAFTDEASLPTDSGTGVKMLIKGKNDYRYVYNVTKPATGIIGLYAGTVFGLPTAGLRPDRAPGDGGYLGGIKLKLIRNAPVARSLILGDMSTAGYETTLAPVNAQWYLGIIAPGTNGVDLPKVCARPLIRTNVSAAAVHPVMLGAMGRF